MTNRAAAARYARALFDVALKESDPQVVEQELAAFVALVAGHDLLKKLLTNPAVPVARKRPSWRSSWRGPRCRRSWRNCWRCWPSAIAWCCSRTCLEQYRQRLLDHEGVVRAEVTTAVPLPAERVQALAHAFGGVTGRRVLVTTRVDPEVIGGVVTRVGSTVYDGSVRRHLERIREGLTAGT